MHSLMIRPTASQGDWKLNKQICSRTREQRA